MDKKKRPPEISRSQRTLRSKEIVPAPVPLKQIGEEQDRFLVHVAAQVREFGEVFFALVRAFGRVCAGNWYDCGAVMFIVI